MRRPRRACRTLTTLSVCLLALVSAAAVHASDDAAAEATIGLHEDLVIGLDPEAPLGRVHDIAVDSAGNIYVLDTGFMTIHKFAPDGRHLADLGREGEAPGEFFAPACLTVGPDGNIYVAGSSSLITVLHPDGTPGPLIQRDLVMWARKIRFGPDGRLYLVGFDPVSQKVVHRYAAGTYEYLDSFCDSYAGARKLEPRIGATYAGGCLDFTPDGDILFGQWSPQRVFLFTAGGELVRTHAVRSSQSPEPQFQVDGDTVHMSFSARTTALFALDDGAFLATLAVPQEGDRESCTLFDIYDADGDRLAAGRVSGWMIPKCRDAKGRIYVPWEKTAADEEDVPVIVRYRMEIVEAGPGSK